MQKKVFSSLNRALLIVLGLLIILFVGLFLALFWRSRQQTGEIADLVSPVLTSEYGRAELVEGDSMSSASYNLNADLSEPNQLQLPLRTLADFPATASATTATIETTAGKLIVELYPEAAPLTVANFVALSGSGFYDDLRFHRVEPDFVVQIGDPASRGMDDVATLQTLGTGYPGYRIQDEFDSHLSHDSAGVLSMANINVDGSYPNSGGSQFFITLAPATYLDGRHAIFGRVTEGLDVLAKIKVGDAIEKITFEQ